MKITVKDITIFNSIFEYKYKGLHKDESDICAEFNISENEYENYEDEICNRCSFIISQIKDHKSIIVDFDDPDARRFYESGMFNYLIEKQDKLVAEKSKQADRIEKDDQIRDKVLFREKYFFHIIIGSNIITFILGMIGTLLLRQCP